MATITPEINLEQVFQSFVQSICADCNRILEEKRLDDTEDVRRDICINLIPIVVNNLVESLYFREFKPYVTVTQSLDGVVVDVTTTNNRICGWTCTDTASHCARLRPQYGMVQVVEDFKNYDM